MQGCKFKHTATQMSADVPRESLCSAQRFLNKVVRENGEENGEEKEEEIFKIEKTKIITLNG